MKIKLSTVIIAICLMLAACGESAPHTAEYQRITPQEAAEMMTGDAIILDVRTLAEFNSGHIEGAVLLPHTDITEYAETVLPDRDQIILVYCQAGRRSETAARLLLEMGYINVFDFGGIAGWHGELVREAANG